MNNKLKEDYIRFTLSLSTSEAQAEMNKLSSSSRELRRTNNELRNSMIELVAAGKKDSEEYRRLEAELKSNSKALSDNSTKLKILQSSMKSTEKSYSQLSREARDLQRQLDNTVKSLQPEEYQRLEKQLEETRQAMSSLRGGTDDTSGSFLKLSNMKAAVAGFFMKIGATAVEWLGQGVEKAREFISESRAIATQADGVQHAFNNLDRPDLLSGLRLATKNTVSDLELMKAAVKAKDFRIPLEDLGKYLQFAQLKAQQTGQSVDYMTDSIVTGLGRKSLLILDNLGLSAAEINEEMAKTGDLMKAVAAIVDRQLSASDLYVSASDRAAQADTRLENVKLKLGQRLSWVNGLFGQMKLALAGALESLLSLDNAETHYYARKAKFIEQEQEHKKRLQELVDILQSEYSSSFQRLEAMQAIEKEYPSIFQKYIDEKGHVKDLIGLWKAYNEERNAESMANNRKTLEQIEQEIAGAQWGYNTAKRLNNRSDMARYKEQLEDLQEQRLLAQADVRKDELKQWQLDLKERTDVQLKAELDEMKRLEEARKNNSRYTLSVGVGTLMGITTEEELKKRIKILEAEQRSRNVQEVRNKSYWETKKKEAEDARAALDISKKNSEEWNKYTTLIREAEEKIAQYGETKKVAVTERNGATSQVSKIKDLQERQALERQRLEEDLESQLTQSRIDAMDEGFEKEQAQRQENNRKELLALERQKEDYIRTFIQFEKEKFDAGEELKAKQTKGYVKQSFDSSSVKVDTSGFDEMISNVTKRQASERIRSQEDAWNEYLLKFGDFQQKRRAIIEKYDREIAGSTTAGAAAILEKEKQDRLDELDNSVRNSTTLMGQLFADASRKSVGEIEKIIEKAELLMDFLESEKDRNGNAVIDGKSYSRDDILSLGVSDNTLHNLEASAQEVETLRNAIGKLKNDLGSRSPFKLFEKEMEDAVERFEKGNLAGGIESIGNAVTSFSPSVKQFAEDVAGIFGEELNEDINHAIEGLSGLGETAVGVGQIMSGDVVGGVMGVVGGISQVVNAMGGLFGPDGTAYYERMREQLDAINEVYDCIIDKSKEDIVFGGGFASIDAASTALDNYYKKVANLQKIADASGRSGASWNSHSAEWHSNKNVGADNFAQMSDLIGKSVQSMDDLYYLSGEELYLIMTQMPEAWSAIDERIRVNLESIVDCKDEAKELQDALNEAVTGISYDTFYNGFIDQLSDMDTSFEDMCDNFEEYLRKSMMAGLVAGKYKEQIRSLYDSWVLAGKDQVYSEDEINELRSSRDELIEAMLEERDNLGKVFGWDSSSSSSSSQSSSKGYSTTMSQETGEEISGRLTAVYESNLRQEGSMLSVSQAITGMVKELSSHFLCITEIRDVLLDCEGHLGKIERYTGWLAGIGETLKEIENNTKEL